MIWESDPWRRQLLRDESILSRLTRATDDTEKQHYRVERIIFVSAYSIRKLYEANKPSTCFDDWNINCSSFIAKSDRITARNIHRFDDLYDIDSKQDEAIKARRLINMIIHSFAFFISGAEDGSINGFCVNSDRTRYEKLYRVDISNYLTIMRDIGRDYPSCVHGYYDDSNEWHEWRGHGNPPAKFLKRVGADDVKNPFEEG